MISPHDRELLSRPKAAKMVGGARNLDRLVRAKTIRPVVQPNGRLGFVYQEIVRWQESARVTRRTPKQYTNDELRAMTEAGYAAEAAKGNR